METLSSDCARTVEPAIGLPLEVKVVINDTRDTRNIDSSVNHVIIVQEETTDWATDGVSVFYERDKDVRMKLPSNDTIEIESHMSIYPAKDVRKEKTNGDATLMYVKEKEASSKLPEKDTHQTKSLTLHETITIDSDHKEESDNVVIDFEYETSMEAESSYKGNNFEIVMIDEIENNTTSMEEQRLETDNIFNEHENNSTEEVHTEKSETTNRFFNELYKKKLDLRNKFSDQEISDIHAAVEQQVNLLSKTIGQVDSRLKIQEVIAVGSAKEGTQIIRPCEYDYILTLEALSKAGAVSITPANTDGSREFMHVKLEDNDVRSEFNDLSDDEYYIRGSHWLPWFRQGLREVFSSAVYQAVMLNSMTSIKMDTGTLKIRRWKPESHGPAFMIRLVWERGTTKNHTTMEISVDLCPALKLEREHRGSVLPSLDRSIFADMGYIETVGSVLLMPREGMLFKVTFTEEELLWTSHLSQHYRKCYKLLKYIVNGEPLPRERLTITNRVMKHFQDANTSFHSYSLKTTVWAHQYKGRCTEGKDLGSCITKMLSSRRRTNPFVNNGNVPTFELEDDSLGQRPTKESLSTSRMDTLLKGLEKFKSTPIEEYNFEAFCRVIGSRGLSKCPAKILAIILNTLISIFPLSLGIDIFLDLQKLDSKKRPMSAIGTILSLCSIAYILFAPGV